MKTQNETWVWHQSRLNPTVARKNSGADTQRVAQLNSAPAIIDNYQSEGTQEAAFGAAKDSHSILHEARNTMTALLLTLEGLTNPRNRGVELEETIEVLKQLSNRLNGSIEKFSVLFSASKPTELHN